MVRRVGEAVHARHYEQYERKVQEARDGDDDEHLVGRVAHAVRSGVKHVWRRPGRRRVVPVEHVVSAVVFDHGARDAVCGGRGYSSGRPPPVRWCHFVVFTVVPDRAPIATAATVVAVAVHSTGQRTPSVMRCPCRDVSLVCGHQIPARLKQISKTENRLTFAL